MCKKRKPLSPKCYRLPFFSVTSCPLLCFSLLPPSLLFVLGTYQPERGERRRKGGRGEQHVRQRRGENSMRRRVTEEPWDRRRTRLILYLFFSGCCRFFRCSLRLLLSLGVTVLLGIKERKKGNERKKVRNSGWRITIVGWGKMEEMKVVPLRIPNNRLLIQHHAATPSVTSHPLSPRPTLRELTLHVKESAEGAFVSCCGEPCPRLVRQDYARRDVHSYAHLYKSRLGSGAGVSKRGARL